MKFARNRKNPTAHPQYPTLGEIMRWTLSKKHLRRSDQQEETEEIKNEMKALHQRDTAQDHRATHDQCPDYSPDQDAMLRARRNAKVRKNEHENKNVIHAQRVFDEVAGEKIQPVMWSFDAPHQRVKSKRQDYPQHAASRRRTHA